MILFLREMDKRTLVSRHVFGALLISVAIGYGASRAEGDESKTSSIANAPLPDRLIELMNMTGSNAEKSKAWDDYARQMRGPYTSFAFSMRDAYHGAAAIEKQLDERASASAAAANALKRAETGIPRDVQENGTRVRWLRCPVGQTWNGTSCTGLKTAMDWKTAKRGCPSGYRLPTIHEYLSLLCGKADDYLQYLASRGHDIDSHGCKSCTHGQKCAEMFGPDASWYWTATDINCRGDNNCKKDHYVYGAAFYSGVFEPHPAASKFFARCVKN
jgi:hypothetical protein